MYRIALVLTIVLICSSKVVALDSEAKPMVTIEESADRWVNDVPAENATWRSHVMLSDSKSATITCAALLNEAGFIPAWSERYYMVFMVRRDYKGNWITHARMWDQPGSKDSATTFEGDSLEAELVNTSFQWLSSEVFSTVENFDCHPITPVGLKQNSRGYSIVWFGRIGRKESFQDLYDELLSAIEAGTLD